MSPVPATAAGSPASTGLSLSNACHVNPPLFTELRTFRVDGRPCRTNQAATVIHLFTAPIANEAMVRVEISRHVVALSHPANFRPQSCDPKLPCLRCSMSPPLTPLELETTFAVTVLNVTTTPCPIGVAENPAYIHGGRCCRAGGVAEHAESCSKSRDSRALSGELPQKPKVYQDLFKSCLDTLLMSNVKDAFILKGGAITVIPKDDAVTATTTTLAQFCGRFRGGNVRFITGSCRRRQISRARCKSPPRARSRVER